MWNSVENLDNLHAAEMVQSSCARPKQPRAAVPVLDRDSGLVFLVSALEVGDLVVAFEVPDAGGDFVD
jgi:hypothetical protein